MSLTSRLRITEAAMSTILLATNLGRVVASRMVDIAASVILSLDVKDITSGFYMAKKKVFSKVTLKQDGYAEYCIRFSHDAIRQGYKWKEVPYTFTDRQAGKSKSFGNILNFVKNGQLCLNEIIRLKFSK